MAPAVKNGYLCTIDTSGRVIADSIHLMSEPNMELLIHVPELFFNDGVYRLKENGRFGYKDHRGQLIAPFIFVEAHQFTSSCAPVRIWHKWGCIDRQGRYIADTIYDLVSDAVDGRIVLRKGDEIAIIDTAGRFVLPFYYKTDPSLFPDPSFSCGLLRVLVRDTAGVQDGTLSFSFWSGRTMDPGWKVGFVNAEGALVIDTVYRLKGALRSSKDDEGYASARGWVCGFAVNERRLHPLPVSYHLDGDYYQFEGERCIVRENEHTMVIDKTGKVCFVMEDGQCADAVVSNIGGFIAVVKRLPAMGVVTSYWLLSNAATYRDADGPNMVFNAHGQRVLNFKYDEQVYRINATQLAAIGEDTHSDRGDAFLKPTRVYDTAGHFLFRFYNSWHPLGGQQTATEGRLTLNGEDGFITSRGKFISRKGGVWLAGDGDNGLWVASQKDKYGFISTSLQWTIPATYEAAQAFSNGLAAVKKGGKWGFIDHKGKVKAPFIYEMVSSFSAVRW